ncbi:MAG: hypothetical protein VXZ73_02280 [Pseudomonadota bacterium]|nr:hypothetical protein [Pseudomonadota bacterium]
MQDRTLTQTAALLVSAAKNLSRIAATRCYNIFFKAIRGELGMLRCGLFLLGVGTIYISLFTFLVTFLQIVPLSKEELQIPYFTAPFVFFVFFCLWQSSRNLSSFFARWFTRIILLRFTLEYIIVFAVLFGLVSDVHMPKRLANPLKMIASA